MPTIDYLPVATAGGANVESQADFAGSTHQTQGFQSGLAKSAQFNKVWRQASMIAQCVANFIGGSLGVNVLDDGVTATLNANFVKAVRVGKDVLVVVPYAATQIFDASLGDTFQTTLTGNVTASTLINLSPNQKLTFLVIEDGTGGRTFSPPSNLPMGSIGTGAAACNAQTFTVLADGTTVVATSPIIIS